MATIKYSGSPEWESVTRCLVCGQSYYESEGPHQCPNSVSVDDTIAWLRAGAEKAAKAAQAQGLVELEQRIAALERGAQSLQIQILRLAVNAGKMTAAICAQVASTTQDKETREQLLRSGEELLAMTNSLMDEEEGQ